MDSDLADAVDGLKSAFQRRKIEFEFGNAPKELVEALKKRLNIPLRFRNFLLGANPVRVETVTPVERVRLFPASEIESATKTVAAETPAWKPQWVLIGESALLGDPYFIDVSKPDPEGDCPVYTAMSGQEKLNPTLAASTFAQFLNILAAAMEIASGFGDAIMDDEDEDSFRKALAPKVKILDTAAMRAGHWT